MGSLTRKIGRALGFKAEEPAQLAGIVILALLALLGLIILQAVLR